MSKTLNITPDLLGLFMSIVRRTKSINFENFHTKSIFLVLKKTDDFDDLLTCTICLETFTGPKYLPCLHTFYKTCINTYFFVDRGEGKTETTFKCPICRQDVLMGE